MKFDKNKINRRRGKEVQQTVAQTRRQIIPLRSINSVYVKIKSILEEARDNVYRLVNFAMVQAYWKIPVDWNELRIADIWVKD